MAVGETRMGGTCSFGDKRLVISVGDFHRSVKDPAHKYRADVLNESGVVTSFPVDPREYAWFSMDAGDCAFYRAEVFDETRNLRIAVGNPIWNGGAKTAAEA